MTYSESVFAPAGARRRFPARLTAAILAAVLAVFAPSGARAGAPGGSFDRSKMEAVELNGLRVWLGAPVRVTSQLGWQTVWRRDAGDPEGTFIHLTPVMAKFPGGNLIATYAMDPDGQDDPITISAFQISKDGGRDWGRRYSVVMQHNPMIFIPGEDDSLTGIASELYQNVPGDDRNFVGSLWIFQKGGGQMLMVPEGMHVVDWPWPLAVFHTPQPRDIWQAGIRITGSVTKIGGRLLITAEIQKKGEVMNRDLRAVLLSSEDGGKTWRYYSTLADPDSTLDSAEGYEGPNEPFVLPLADGTLMGVFRVGSGEKWHLRRSYSRDQGRTWTKSEALPAWSVKPQLVLNSNGAIALTTGRPGIRLWLATDPGGTGWQSVDLVRHHNEFVADCHDRISQFSLKGRMIWQTSSYTGLVGLENNRMLVCYDRDPEELPTGPDDRSGIFVVPIELEKR